MHAHTATNTFGSRSFHRKPRTRNRERRLRTEQRDQRLRRTKFRSPLPTRKTADLVLVGLLTPEPSCPAFSSRQRDNGKRMGRDSPLSYSGGDRPGMAPGSLLSALQEEATDHQHTTNAGDYRTTAACCQASRARPRKKTMGGYSCRVSHGRPGTWFGGVRVSIIAAPCSRLPCPVY